MNEQEENALRRGLHAMVADPPRVAPATDAIASAHARRRRDRAGLAGLAVLVVAAIAVPSVLMTRDAGTPPAPTAAGPSAPSPSTVEEKTVDSGPPAPPGTELATGPADPAVGSSYRYDLFVHCGIRYAKFGGRWWQAEPRQPEPRTTYGGGLYVPGTMALVAADEARFTSDTPTVDATFRPLAGEPEPCD
ncbi:hypothetical protein ACQP2Y_12115 [Actinoplanes sp. CA-051413]|uniref:hypothetical protein n=1 Tax=Actinoplanes sp. CA-051413 TaxID=3239899 RepID=UPI003D97BBDD